MQSAGNEHISRKSLSLSQPYNGCLVLLSILLFVKAVVFLSRAALVLKYPYEWSTMDGYFVYYGLRLVSGQPIYFGYESILMPFEYVPLYPAVIGILAKIFGPNVWYERCFGVVCSLIIAAITGVVVARRTGNRTAAAAAGLLFLAPSLLSVWYIVRGIDILAVLLGVAGFFVIAEARERSGPQIAFATAIFVLAFYAKQTVVFPAAAAVAFIFSRDIKKGLLMAAGYGGGVLGVLFLLQFLTGGWFFENAFLTTSNNPYFFWLFLEFLWKYFLCLFIAFPIALFQACRGVSRQPNAWALYFFATLISIFLAGKIGAALSYFLPLFSATCICLGLFIGDSSFSEKRARVSIVVMLLMLVQAVALFRDYIPIPTHEDRRQAALLDEHIKQNPGEILVERIDSFATLNERELNIEAVQLPILVMREKVSPRILAGAIEKKEFSLIVYSGIHFGGIPVIKRAIFENYRAIDEVNVGLFYGKGTFLVLSPR